MVNVIKDNRRWTVLLLLSNEDCPHLYYPVNIYGCRLLPEDNCECTLENCPIKLPSIYQITDPKDLIK